MLYIVAVKSTSYTRVYSQCFSEKEKERPYGRLYIAGSYLNAKVLGFVHILLGRENDEFILIQFQRIAVRPNSYHSDWG